AAEAHPVGGLRGAVQLHGVSRFAAARDRAFGINQVFVDGREARGRTHRLHVGILAIKIGNVLKRSLPGSFIELERNSGVNGDEWSGLREIVDRTSVGAKALEFGLFFGERLAGGFVRAVGGQPDLVAKGNRIVVKGENVAFAFAARVEAVLFVIADAHNHAEDAIVPVLAFA